MSTWTAPSLAQMEWSQFEIIKGNNIIQVAGYVNDAAGNETSDSVHGYAYDAEYNLISVDGGNTAKHYYNALNQRVEIDNAQGSREFTYDFAGRRIGTWTPGTSTETQGQIWWGSSPLAYRGSDGTTYFQQADWVGTQRILSNYAGSVSSTYSSRPWGETYATTGKDDNIFHYGGLEQSENTGIQHARHRNGTTYFQQADWVGSQRISSNYAGSVSSAYGSRPWGEAYTASGTDDNISHYAGPLRHPSETPHSQSTFIQKKELPLLRSENPGTNAAPLQ